MQSQSSVSSAAIESRSVYYGTNHYSKFLSHYFNIYVPLIKNMGALTWSILTTLFLLLKDQQNPRINHQHRRLITHLTFSNQGIPRCHNLSPQANSLTACHCWVSETTRQVSLI